MLESASPFVPPAGDALRIAVLGAECTGKSELVLQLREALALSTGLRVAAVMEFLREWCELQQRTPEAHEQASIAHEQQRRIDEAARTHDIVVCDTTPLMTAIYSQWYFGDRALHASALSAHGRAGVTLVTDLDLPWQPDGLQRDGTTVRGAIDRLLRATLDEHAVPYHVIAGHGERRTLAALAVLETRITGFGAARRATAGTALRGPGR